MLEVDTSAKDVNSESDVAPLFDDKEIIADLKRAVDVYGKLGVSGLSQIDVDYATERNVIPQPEKDGALVRMWENIWEEGSNKVMIFAVLLEMVISFGTFSYHGPRTVENAQKLFLNLDFIATKVFLAMTFFGNAKKAIDREDEIEQKMDELKKKDTRSVVLDRGGQIFSVDPTELVPGDLIHIKAGDALYADALVVEGFVKMDHSQANGETIPAPRSVFDGKFSVDSLLRCGTTVKEGSAKARVLLVGERCSKARLTTGEKMDSEFEKMTGAFLELLLYVVGAVSVSYFLACYRGGEMHSIADLKLTPLATKLVFDWVKLAKKLGDTSGLISAAVPEGAKGIQQAIFCSVALRSADGFLMSDPAAAAELSKTSRVLSDKTGTLTGKEVVVMGAYDANGKALSVEKSNSLTYHAALACGVIKTENGEFDGNPTGVALGRYVDGRLKQSIVAPLGSVRQPFDSERKLASIQVPEGGGYVTRVLGSPELLLARCVGDDAGVLAALKELEDQGLRTVGVAKSPVRALIQTVLGNNATYDEAESGLTFEGFITMRNAPRPGTREAIQTMHEAGVWITMVTGDRQASAMHTAKEVGMKVAREISGPDFAALVPKEKIDFFKGVQGDSVIYCSGSNTKKVAVAAARLGGDVVLGAGDGANDVSFLWFANTGVAMQEGSDAPKEIPKISIATKNSFVPIVDAMIDSRRALYKVREAYEYQLGTNVAEATFPVIFMLLGFPVYVTGLMWLLMNRLTDFSPSEMADDPADLDELKAEGPLRGGLLTVRGWIRTAVIFAATTAVPMISTIYFSTHATFLGFHMNAHPVSMEMLLNHEAFQCPEGPHGEVDAKNATLVVPGCNDDNGSPMPAGTVQFLSIVFGELLILYLIPRWGAGAALRNEVMCMVAVAVAVMFAPLYTALPNLPVVPAEAWAALAAALSGTALLFRLGDIPPAIKFFLYFVVACVAMLYIPASNMVGVVALSPGAILFTCAVPLAVMLACSVVLAVVDRIM